MSATYLVTVVFSIKNANDGSYAKADRILSKLGFKNSIEGKKVNVLPRNCYVGEFKGSDTRKIREDLADAVSSEFKNAELSGSVYVVVGGDWSWGMRYPNQ